MNLLEPLLAPLFALLGGFIPLIGIVALVFFLRQRKGQEEDIPPLDLVDAKKLDDMVAKQIEAALKPILRSDDYPEEQIQEILTRTSVKGRVFRR